MQAVESPNDASVPGPQTKLNDDNGCLGFKVSWVVYKLVSPEISKHNF